MEQYLRIRELARTGTKVLYKDVDVETGVTANRGIACAAMTRPRGELTEHITFLPDTPHNRCLLMARKETEVAYAQGSKWVVVPEAWLEGMFAPAKNATPLPLEGALSFPTKPPSKPKKTGEPATISGIADFLNLSKTDQQAAVNKLVMEVPSDFRSNLLTELATCTDSGLSPKARKMAVEAVHSGK